MPSPCSPLPRPPPPPRYSFIEETFSVHPTALAMGRVALGIVLIYDNIFEWLKYSDSLLSKYGVIPVNSWVFNQEIWSIFRALDVEWFSMLLVLMTIIASVFLVIGYHTKTASIVIWMLTLSIQNRHDLPLHGGDHAMRHLCFYHMFLPSSDYSVDKCYEMQRRGQRPKKKNSILSWCTAALHMNLWFLYIEAGLLKTGVPWTSSFTAVYEALSYEILVKDLGVWLSQFDSLGVFLTLATLFIEFYLPFVFPIASLKGFDGYRGVMKTLTTFSFIIMHLSFHICMNLGMFPFICIAWWFLTFHVEFIEYLDNLGPTLKRKRDLVIEYISPQDPLGVEPPFSAALALTMTAVSARHLKTASASTRQALRAGGYCWCVAERDENTGMLTMIDDPVEGVVVWVAASPILKWFLPLLRLYFVQNLIRFVCSTLLLQLFWNWMRHAPICVPLLPVEEEIEHIKRLKKTLYSRKETTPWKRLTKTGTRMFGYFVIVSFTLTMWAALADKDVGMFPEPPEYVHRMLSLFRYHQKWNMFCPSPALNDGWWVAAGQFADSTERELLRSRELSPPGSVVFAKPHPVWPTYMEGSVRWTKVLGASRVAPYGMFLDYVTLWLCHKYDQLNEVELFFVGEDTLPDHKVNLLQPKLLANRTCTRTS